MRRPPVKRHLIGYVAGLATAAVLLNLGMDYRIIPGKSTAQAPSVSDMPRPDNGRDYPTAFTVAGCADFGVTAGRAYQALQPFPEPVAGNKTRADAASRWLADKELWLQAQALDPCERVAYESWLRVIESVSVKAYWRQEVGEKGQR